MSIRKRGRPRTVGPAPPTNVAIHYGYKPPEPGEVNGAQLAASLRRSAEEAEKNERHEYLAGWYRAMADAIDKNDAALVAWCALYAAAEVQVLTDFFFKPLARVGRRKLEADKRRGRRT